MFTCVNIKWRNHLLGNHIWSLYSHILDDCIMRTTIKLLEIKKLAEITSLWACDGYVGSIPWERFKSWSYKVSWVDDHIHTNRRGKAGLKGQAVCQRILRQWMQIEYITRYSREIQIRLVAFGILPLIEGNEFTKTSCWCRWREEVTVKNIILNDDLKEGRKDVRIFHSTGNRSLTCNRRFQDD